MRTCVIFNPAAKGDKARSFRKHLDQFGGTENRADGLECQYLR